MKRFACYIFFLLILLSLMGCAGTESVHESNEDSIANTDKIILTSTPTPCDYDVDTDRIVPDMPHEPTLIDLGADTEPTTTIPPTPTPRSFDVNDVKMQATPQSSCFSEIGYDSEWGILVVQFRDSSSVYTYSNFPMGEWSKFVSADSLGRWFNKYIKGNYDCERIN